MFNKKSIKVKEKRLKCLLCGEFFFKTEEQLAAAIEESKNPDIHPNDAKHKIVCPKCNNDKIQIIIDNTTIAKNKFENLQKQYDSISSFIGGFFGGVIGLFITVWEENQFSLVKQIFKFLGFAAAIYCLSSVLYIPTIYGSGVVLLYFFLNKK